MFYASSTEGRYFNQETCVADSVRNFNLLVFPPGDLRSRFSKDFQPLSTLGTMFSTRQKTKSTVESGKHPVWAKSGDLAAVEA